MAATYLYVDASDLSDLLDSMKSKLTPANFDRLMRRSLNEVGKRSKKPIREAVQLEYEAPTSWVNAGIKNARISGGGGTVLCTIPLIGAKGNIGSTFKAGGGAPGWNPPKYRVTARIVKGGASTLPSSMSHQGGQPPFRNTSYSGLTFARTGQDRLPIVRVSGLALPQMPMNKARDETEDKILALTEKRVMHNFSHMFG